jgi:hypothetical protein
MTERSTGNMLITMGVDVGKFLHWEIDQWDIDRSIGSPDINIISTPRVLAHGKVMNFEELDGLMYQYGVGYCVIDANPERRKALEFAQRMYGRVRLCFYGNGVSGKTIHLHNDIELTMTVDRTSWLDLSLGRFRSKRIRLPIDTTLDYKNHLCSLVRLYKLDKNGNPTGSYVKGSEDDHYAHARNYAEMALPLCAGLQTSQDMETAP